MIAADLVQNVLVSVTRTMKRVGDVGRVGGVSGDQNDSHVWSIQYQWPAKNVLSHKPNANIIHQTCQF